MVHAGAGSPKKPAARPRVLRKRSFGVWMLNCSALEVFSQHFPIAEVLEGFRPADTAQAWNTSVASSSWTFLGFKTAHSQIVFMFF